jgi:hypothetical protein
MLASMSSPVVGVFVVVAAGAWGWSDRESRRRAIEVVGAALVPLALITVWFPDGGTFPYRGVSLVWDLAVCAAVFLAARQRHRAIAWGAVLYGTCSMAAFVVHSALGGNVARLGQFIAGPLLACLLWPRRRILVAALAVPLVIWQWAPTVDAMTQSPSDPSTQRAYYTGVVSYLSSQANFGRVEIPFTLHHWEAAYVAEDVALARGWERQLDIQENPQFYAGNLTATDYSTWLDANGVALVALPDTKLDPSSVAEKRLLQTGVPNLVEVWSDPHWTVWRVLTYNGLISGPARIVQMTPSSFELDVTGPGTVDVKVRPSSHWAVDGQGCAHPDGRGWLSLEDLARGRVVVSQALGGTPCP